MSILDFFKSNKKRTGVIISAIIIVIGIIPLLMFTFYADPVNPYSITPMTLTSDDGTNIDVLVYTPNTIEGNVPGVVVAHGYCSSKQFMQLLCIEIVKRGIIVVNIDFRGHGSSGGSLPSIRNAQEVNQLEEDVWAAIQYLRGLGNVDRLGLVGHSMGGMTVTRIANRYPNVVNATVSLGMVPEQSTLQEMVDAEGIFQYDITKIKNYMMAVGQIEQIYTQDIALASLKEYTGLASVEVNMDYGSFAAGTAGKVVVGPGAEHLMEPINTVILYEMVHWFERTFFTGERDAINITCGLDQIAFLITLIGVFCLDCVLILYLYNYLWKKEPVYPRKDLAKEVSLVKLVLMYFLAGLIGGGLLVPLALLFIDATAISMGNFLLAFLAGASIGAIIVYYLFILRKEREPFSAIPSKIIEMSSNNYKRSLIFGILSALLFVVSISSISHWSISPLFPTLREAGAMVGLVLLFFPFMLVKEFYFRMVQGKLEFQNRFKEYATMVGIGILLDCWLLFPLLFVTWGSGGIISFLALVLTAFILLLVMQQLLVTWVYMYSGRNIVGSTIFTCIFYSYIIINFFPFGASVL